MKKEEVRELARQFAAALEEEKQIRVQLMDLKMVGPSDEVDRNLKKHDSLIEGIAKLRQDKMLPILETLSEFIAEKTGTLRTPQQRLRDAVADGKKRVATGVIRDGMVGKAGAKKSSKKGGKSGKKSSKSGAKSK